MTSSIWEAVSEVLSELDCRKQVQSGQCNPAFHLKPIQLKGRGRSKSTPQSEKLLTTASTVLTEKQTSRIRLQCCGCQVLRNQLIAEKKKAGMMEAELLDSKRLITRLQGQSRLWLTVSSTPAEIDKTVVLYDRIPEMRNENHALKAALQQCKDIIATQRREIEAAEKNLEQWQVAFRQLLAKNLNIHGSFNENTTSILNTAQPNKPREHLVSLRTLDQNYKAAVYDSTQGNNENSFVNFIESINRIVRPELKEQVDTIRSKSKMSALKMSSSSELGTAIRLLRSEHD